MPKLNYMSLGVIITVHLLITKIVIVLKKESVTAQINWLWCHISMFITLLRCQWKCDSIMEIKSRNGNHFENKICYLCGWRSFMHQDIWQVANWRATLVKELSNFSSCDTARNKTWGCQHVHRTVAICGGSLPWPTAAERHCTWPDTLNFQRWKGDNSGAWRALILDSRRVK